MFGITLPISRVVCHNVLLEHFPCCCCTLSACAEWISHKNISSHARENYVIYREDLYDSCFEWFSEIDCLDVITFLRNASLSYCSAQNIFAIVVSVTNLYFDACYVLRPAIISLSGLCKLWSSSDLNSFDWECFASIDCHPLVWVFIFRRPGLWWLKRWSSMSEPRLFIIKCRRIKAILFSYIARFFHV